MLGIGTRGKPTKLQWPLFVAAAIALAVFVYLFILFNGKIAQAQQTVSIVVPRQSIQAYSSITAGNLTVANVPLAVASGYMARSIGQVAGMTPTAQLFTGEPIDLRLLEQPSQNAGNLEVVPVRVDAATSDGAKAGDLVDLYWLQPQQGAWTPSLGSVLIAQNVRVLELCDENGQPITSGQQSSSVLGAVSAPVSQKAPAIVYLLVQPDDVAKVVNGAADKNLSTVLVRKPAPTLANTTQEGGTAIGTEGNMGNAGGEQGNQPAGGAGTPAAQGNAAGGGGSGQNSSGGTR